MNTKNESKITYEEIKNLSLLKIMIEEISVVYNIKIYPIMEMERVYKYI